MQQSTYRKLRSLQYDIGTDQSEIVGFYLEQWRRLGKPTPALEPMCGTGLNLLPFLEADADIDGLDSSPTMLEVCKRKLDSLGLDCNLYEQFLEEMDLPRQYEFIFIPGGSYGHIHDKAVAAKCLKRMRDHLLPGGWLVFDVRPPAYMDNFGKPGEVDFDLDELDDGSTVFTTGYWDHLDDGRLIRKWNKMEQFVDDQLVETEIFDYRERMYDVEEMKTELRAVGFEEIHIAKAYAHDALPEGKDGIVFSCRRS